MLAAPPKSDALTAPLMEGLGRGAPRHVQVSPEMTAFGAAALAPGQVEAREREHARRPRSCTMSGLRPIFAPCVTNVNVQN